MKSAFDPTVFLAQAGVGRKIVSLNNKETAFLQGDPGDSIFYIQSGSIRLSVTSRSGKEAIVAMLGAGDFCGEECVVNSHSVRIVTARAITPCTLLKIDKKQMIRVLHQEHSFSDVFVAYLLARNARVQEDLVDQLFNSSEKRLARVLLLLAQFGKDKTPEQVIPKISQEVLAEMVGTTRARVNFFMNRFRKLGFIGYDGAIIEVHSSLLSVVLHD
jgi:CRP/FNR family cyclic AMP-dependent transcriptional regulator